MEVPRFNPSSGGEKVKIYGMSVIKQNSMGGGATRIATKAPPLLLRSIMSNGDEFILPYNFARDEYLLYI